MEVGYNLIVTFQAHHTEQEISVYDTLEEASFWAKFITAWGSRNTSSPELLSYYKGISEKGNEFEKLLSVFCSAVTNLSPPAKIKKTILEIKMKYSSDQSASVQEGYEEILCDMLYEICPCYGELGWANFMSAEIYHIRDIELISSY